MGEGGFFYQAFVYLSAAVVAVPLAKKLGLGSVLGYLFAGIIIGPFVFGLVGDEGQDVLHFAEFGVVMMLFLIGLELQPSKIWKLRVPIIGLGGSQVVITAMLIAIVAIAVGLPWPSAIAIGLSLALSSTAIVIQTLNEKNLFNTDGGQNAFSVLLFQDIAVIPILAIMPLLAVGGGEAAVVATAGHHAAEHKWIEDLPVWGQTGVVLGAVSLIVLAGRYLMNPGFRMIAKTGLRELFTAAALLLVIAITLIMTEVGVSPALGTFLAGAVLAQSEYRHELETDIEPFKGLLLGLFFIAVGASIDFALIIDQPFLIAQLVVTLIAIKFVVLALLGKLFKMSIDSNLLFTFALAQGGEFAFVLFSFATQNAVLGYDIVNPLIAAVAVTMALTPLLMVINEQLILPKIGTREKALPLTSMIEQKGKIIIAGFGRVGSTIGRFLQAHGLQATYLDVDPDNVELLRKMGFEVYYGDASRRDLLHAAGADSAKMLVIAVNDPDKSKKITETVKKHYPHLAIFARTYSWLDSYELIDMGVDQVYRETQDTSLRIGAEILGHLGYRKHPVQRALKIFRKQEKRNLRELAKHYHDRKTLLREAKQRIEDLEELMLTENKNRGTSQDLGWDAESLRQEFNRSRE